VIVFPPLFGSNGKVFVRQPQENSFVNVAVKCIGRNCDGKLQPTSFDFPQHGSRGIFVLNDFLLDVFSQGVVMPDFQCRALCGKISPVFLSCTHIRVLIGKK
jgi:hypothetical protein